MRMSPNYEIRSIPNKPTSPFSLLQTRLLLKLNPPMHEHDHFLIFSGLRLQSIREPIFIFRQTKDSPQIFAHRDFLAIDRIHRKE